MYMYTCRVIQLHMYIYTTYRCLLKSLCTYIHIVAREICKKSEWVASSISGEDDVVLQLTLIEAPIDLEAQTIRDKDDYSPKTTLLLCNIPVNTNEDHLRCYIGWVTNLNSGEFEFSIRNQKAVLVVPRGIHVYI